MGRELGDDLDDPTEDTDKSFIPQFAQRKKLTLPKPDDFDRAPTPVPAKAPVRAPIAKPPPPKRIPVFRVEPERSSSRWIMVMVALIVSGIVAAFLLAPDASSPARAAQNRTKRGPAQQAEKKSLVDWFSFASGDDSEPPGDAPAPNAPRYRKPPPQRTRNPYAAQRSQKGKASAPQGDGRFGFERAEQPRRLYDNFDTTVEQGSGIPMLMVFSKPRGMAVDVDGTLMGITPLIRPMPKGTKRVKVRIHGVGFKDWEQTVSPNELDQFKVGVTMQRIAE